ncbi:MAG: hypothetical protein AUK48_03040 [Oscillatoriales cyanobacterium CG2_30_44_21]|nr:MAG: hypothetical protein AUK48_03040 [Oscillatoriales cyanobacterium CG2_30_44_21]
MLCVATYFFENVLSPISKIIAAYLGFKGHRESFESVASRRFQNFLWVLSHRKSRYLSKGTNRYFYLQI